jgi:hypothetical protein
MKMAVFWNVRPCGQAAVSSKMSDYMVSHSTRQFITTVVENPKSLTRL